MGSLSPQHSHRGGRSIFVRDHAIPQEAVLPSVMTNGQVMEKAIRNIFWYRRRRLHCNDVPSWTAPAERFADNSFPLVLRI